MYLSELPESCKFQDLPGSYEPPPSFQEEYVKLEKLAVPHRGHTGSKQGVSPPH